MYKQKINDYIKQGIFDGAVILAGNLTKDLFIHTQGLANRNTNKPMSLDTVFDISSISKPLGCATCILLLAESGLINLENSLTVKFSPELNIRSVTPISDADFSVEKDGDVITSLTLKVLHIHTAFECSSGN